MTVTVKCFAIARDLAGFAERAIEVADGATAGDVLDRVVALAPALAAHAERMALAVNLEYVGRAHPVRDGDEVAFIPPVSGGCAAGQSDRPRRSQDATAEAVDSSRA